MLETIFTIGQAASALLIIYGAYLVVMPARTPQARTAADKEELALSNS